MIRTQSDNQLRTPPRHGLRPKVQPTSAEDLVQDLASRRAADLAAVRPDRSLGLAVRTWPPMRTSGTGWQSVPCPRPAVGSEEAQTPLPEPPCESAFRCVVSVIHNFVGL
jgi:hypothetical protein